MKKLLLIGLCGFALAACGSDEGNDTEVISTPESSSEVATSTEMVESSEVASSEEVVDSGVYFKDDVLKIEMATVKLLDAEVLPANEYVEKPQLAITYEFTNDNDEPLQPMMVFIACFNATQETDITIEDLDVSMSPQEERFTEMNDMSSTDIKPGGTVQSVITYEIKYEGEPITLTATQGVMGEELGKKVYEFE